MMLRTKGVRILVGLLVLGGVLAGVCEAQAGGITIKASGGPVGGSDPFFFYQFDVSLAPNFQWFPGDSFTIESLPGITPPNPPVGDTGNNPNLPSPGSSSGYSGPFSFGPPVITITDSTSPFASNVEWLNTTNTTITAGATGRSLGSFYVYTSVSLTGLPPTVTYIALSHDQNGDPDSQPPATIVLTSVPEPSSVVLFLCGTGVLSLILIRQRRRLSANLKHPV